MHFPQDFGCEGRAWCDAIGAEDEFGLFGFALVVGGPCTENQWGFCEFPAWSGVVSGWWFG